MASLTHVSMWSEHGWKRITANEAARIHPGGNVSAASGLFMCELCGQYVILTDGDKNIRHFRHKISEKSKDCPERTFGSSVHMTYDARQYELPIRICNITDNQFDLELGLLYIPRPVLQAQEIQQVIIQPLGNEDTSYVYSFERLNLETITYVYIGNIPAPKYQLSVEGELKNFWPKYVRGIDRSGSIFVQKTGKKLPYGADIQIENSYFLLSAKRICFDSSDIEIEKICEKKILKDIWYIYKVKATAFTENAAQFFLDFHCRLTESHLSLWPVWPVYTKTPYVIQHDRDQLLIYICGGNDIIEKTFPEAMSREFSCLTENSKVVEVYCNGRQQLISIGRTEVLEYTYFWREPLNKIMPKPVVEISDINGNALDSGVQYELPDQRILCVNAQFDGTVIILGDKIVQEKRILKAGARTEIDNIYFGTEIKITQGLDMIWSARYERKTEKVVRYDLDIARRLKSFHGKMIPISHEVGSTIGQLENYPEVKKWLYKRLRDGYISEDALRYFKFFIIRTQSGR